MDKTPHAFSLGYGFGYPRGGDGAMKTYPYKSKRKMKHHGREGFPIIHKDKKTGKTYVMVRKKGGATKRLYGYEKYMG